MEWLWLLQPTQLRVFSLLSQDDEAVLMGRVQVPRPVPAHLPSPKKFLASCLVGEEEPWAESDIIPCQSQALLSKATWEHSWLPNLSIVGTTKSLSFLSCSDTLEPTVAVAAEGSEDSTMMTDSSRPHFLQEVTCLFPVSHTSA